MPKHGSLQESVLVNFMIRRDEIEVAKTRAIVQTLIDKKAGAEAFDTYFKASFPWVETVKKREVADWVKRLNEEVKRGPLTVTPIPDQKFKSRLKMKTVEKQTLSSEAQAAIRSISSKLPPIHGVK